MSLSQNHFAQAWWFFDWIETYIS